MPAGSARPVFTAGECEIDLARRELRLLGSPVPVGGRAFEIIEVLAQSAGELVTKNELMDRVWPGAVVLENTLQVHIAAVRRALGPHRAMLKTEAGRGYRLLGDWTAQDPGSTAPPVRPQQQRASASEPPPTNLPAIVAGLIGRAVAASLLRDALSAYRVATLTGPGGIGKTTLAIEVARNLLPDFDSGAWVVELASLTDPDLVPSAVVSALGLSLFGEDISAVAVARAIGGKRLLLVLDNCEHVIDAAAELAEIIVRLCSYTTVLATSREVLRIEGEYVYRVPPLDVPASDCEEPDHILSHSAVTLFIARATAMDSDFSPQAENLASIAAVCRRLDGIPLAIEFAAARASTLGVDRVAAELQDRFALLTDGRRTALPRHQTLRAVLDWSYQLLPKEGQQLLCHLAIFPAAFTFEAAAAVGTAGDEITSIAEGLSSLVSKSLLNRDRAAPMPRWRMLETTRVYALEKFSNGERQAVARRYAEYFHDLIVPSTTGPVLRLTLDDVHRYALDVDNIRVALDWAFSRDGDVPLGISLTAAIAPVWVHLSLVVECRERAEQALELLRPEFNLSKALERRLLMALGVALAVTLGPVERTREVIAKARQLAGGIDDLEVQLRMLWAQWSMELTVGEYRAALSTAQQFGSVASSTGDPALVLAGDRFLGSTLVALGRLREARDCLQRVVDHYVAPPSGHHTILFHYDQRMIARASLARVLYLLGCADQAAELARQSFEDAQAGDVITYCWVLHSGVCPVAIMAGDTSMGERGAAILSDLATRCDAAMWKIAGACWEGKLLIERGEFAKGSNLLREALDLCEQSGWQTSNIEFLGCLAQGLAGLGMRNEALGAIERALIWAERSGDLEHAPELIRIKGTLLFEEAFDGMVAAAEECFVRAGELAREQGALFWELRTAVSFAHLRVAQGRRDEARQILEPIYGWFTEGFGTPDLLSAKALLDAL